MGNYIISACSTADLTKEQFEERGIACTYFHFNLDGEIYPDDLGQTVPFKEFYDKLRNGSDSSTSQVNPEEFVESLSPHLEAGLDVIHVTLSSGISGVYNSAMIAKQELEEKYPDRKIYVIDSLCASTGYGLLLDKMVELKNSGMSIDELAEWTEANKLRLNHWVLTTDLTFLVKGGRVSKTSGFFGGMLNICPIIDVNSEGKLIAREKIRTKKKGITALVNKMVECADDGIDYSEKVYISMSDCYDDAKVVADLVEEKFTKKKGDVLINYIGTVIGSHTGPGTIALFFWGKEREL